MLMLLFRVGEESWAIAANEVREVLPLVALQAMAQGWSDGASHSSYWQAGLMNYRDQTLPVVDVSALLSGQAAEQTLNTRIVVIEVDESAGELAGQSRRQVGLMLSHASNTTQLMPLANIPVASRYVHSTWQLSKTAEVVYQLATAPILAQVYQLSADFVASGCLQADFIETAVTTNGFSQEGV